ncbi:phosphotransferase [Dasania sp. GY-MA-18]|uniref:Phosphotransferase n=1 Tax=Dasania phycosphaerae TaxID=2950436 RepID=A0A9J6RK05_9GAMM|nr:MULTISPECIES: phosphotransferase [Dasania]MCR8922312.1 phosphotransferase [Dasania sp. GY-MA-18]MCZ0864740.1 phosphotransferase [Dasania phycosphaerae]MCZ0868468.1 phosphotransferase [Dasania phycosphaerae]
MLAKDKRQQALEQWASSQLGQPVVGVPASTDASFRRYFRYTLADQRSVIGMDAPPDTENNPAFVDIAQRLAQAGLTVPEIIAYEQAQGFLLLSDLGTQTYLQAINADNAQVLMSDAIQALVTMQTHTASAGLPAYDEALLSKELALFPEWYIGRHLNEHLSPAAKAEISSLFNTLSQQLLTNISAQGRVFVHRDYMPRNLMLSDAESKPAIIDFQDAVYGPVSYDPICLFKDAFISWPEPQVQAWLQQYWQQAVAAQLPVAAQFEDFLTDCDYMGVQRHLKVLGIFARIHYRDGKPQYLQDAPRFIAYLQTVSERRPELSSLTSLLAIISPLVNPLASKEQAQ